MNWHKDLQLESLRQQLLNHELYRLLDSPKAICIFMQHHVWAVWDFQSLLKSLQIKLTCTDIPWLPTPDTISRRLINEIVLGEESDEDGSGGYLSHFELYLKAMKEINADTKVIENFLVLLRHGVNFNDALQKSGAPDGVIPFVRETINLAKNGPLHSIVASFTLGREDLLPGLFLKILEKASDQYHFSYSTLRYYLNRHIELDGDSHGPLAIAMLDSACKGDKAKEEEALQTARKSLQVRLDLWAAICNMIKA